MKFISNIVITELEDEYIAVLVGENPKRCIIKLNKTGSEICRYIINGLNEEEIIDKLIKDYEIDKDTAKHALVKVTSRLLEEGLLEE